MENQPSVTVVVPTRNTERTLAACLASVRRQTYPDVELVVVDNNSTDRTMEIAKEYADQAVTWGPERSAQRNHGWRIGRGEICVFVDADMVLDERIVAEAVAAFAAGGSDLGALVIPELAFGEGFLARCRGLEKRLYLGDSRVEAARVFPRRLLAETGGYAEGVTGFEDWELPDRIRAKGYRIGRVTSFVLHDEGRIGLLRAFTKKRYYGRWLTVYRSAEHGTAPSRTMARPALFAHPGQIFRAPHLFAGLIVLKAAEWSGLLLGAYQGRRGQRDRDE